jgi:hypothetical protein
MQHASVEVLLYHQMPHTGDERLPERPIIGPCGKDFVDGRVVDGGLALRVVRDGQALPLHSGIEYPEDEVKDPVLAQFALRAPLGHGEMRQDKCGELVFGQLHGNRRRCRLYCRGAHQGRASCEAWLCALENRIASETTRG